MEDVNCIFCNVSLYESSDVKSCRDEGEDCCYPSEDEDDDDDDCFYKIDL